MQRVLLRKKRTGTGHQPLCSGVVAAYPSNDFQKGKNAFCCRAVSAALWRQSTLTLLRGVLPKSQLTPIEHFGLGLPRCLLAALEESPKSASSRDTKA